MEGTHRLSRRQVLKGVAGLSVASGIGGLLSSHGLRTERVQLKLPNWTANGMRIAQITDIHVNTPQLEEIAKEAVNRIYYEKPDLVVFTGDFINWDDKRNMDRIERVFAPLRDLSCPSYCVLGNHDYSCGWPPYLLETIHKRTCLKVLRNQVAEFDGISIVGIDDWCHGYGRPEIMLDAKLSKSTLVLWHEPDSVDELPVQASLQLSGHSHGGEVCLPGGIPLHVPSGANRYYGGFYEHTKTPLYVSRGTATLGPARLFCPPEVTFLTLESA